MAIYEDVGMMGTHLDVELAVLRMNPEGVGEEDQEDTR
jgi:hypothetical protein